MSNPVLCVCVKSLVRSVYNRNRDMLINSAYDLDDLMQDLLLVLCEESCRSSEAHYQRLCTDRLKDIIKHLRRMLTDYNREIARLVSTETMDQTGEA